MSNAPEFPGDRPADEKGRPQQEPQQEQNPFADDMRSGPPPSDNPYAAPRSDTYLPSGGPYETMAPHRGGMVLGLGLGGLALSLFSSVGSILFFCCCLPFVLGSLAFSVPAWLLGRADLAAMNLGAMDPRGRSVTQIGMICGIIGTVVCLLWLVAFVGFIVFAMLTGDVGGFDEFDL